MVLDPVDHEGKFTKSFFKVARLSSENRLFTICHAQENNIVTLFNYINSMTLRFLEQGKDNLTL
jgi:hypothetical protein